MLDFLKYAVKWMYTPAHVSMISMILFQLLYTLHLLLIMFIVALINLSKKVMLHLLFLTKKAFNSLHNNKASKGKQTVLVANQH